MLTLSKSSLSGVASVPSGQPSGREDLILLSGPRSRLGELWRVVRIAVEFIQGFRALHFVGPCVTVFGSARCTEAHPSYEVGRALGRRIAASGFTVMTGGGPGLMEAANRGAKEAGGRSVGCNIQLPAEQQPNAYLDGWTACRHFFVRKVLLFKYFYAFVALPGGLGTMDELFEALTLVQTRKIQNFPVVLIGSAYWQPLVDLLAHMVVEETIDQGDLRLLLVTDDLDVVMEHLERNAVRQFGLERRPRPRPSSWLGERAPRPASR